MDVARDTDVVVKGDSLQGRNILFAVTGGIAAVESIRLARELRRHGANLTIMMTREAEKIITPLALSWASGTEVMTSWDYEMSQLENHDAVLVAPATRNTISKHIHGIMDSPVLMALSAARGNGTPTLFVPSMHSDIFDDSVTRDLLKTLRDEGSAVMISEIEEGRRKQPDPISIVANFCNMVNKELSGRKIVAITLGANRAPIDDVRAIQNASSGSTGWTIAEYLHRMGHHVICIAGKTSAYPSFTLPDVRRAGSPDSMLSAAKTVASGQPQPDAWIHSAAVLDYYTEPINGKKPSGDDPWELILIPGVKHIAELSPLVDGAIRIGFKLESDVSDELLVLKAKEQIERYGVDAVVANLKDEIHDPDTLRGRFVRSDGTVDDIHDDAELCQMIESLLNAA
ncbi:MAG: hypothetical protein CMB04_01265 [Euryarchaeota archaeon]|nr:hypothetical protein [Euryarchaeota archaeon]